MKQNSKLLISLFIAGALTACNGGGHAPSLASNSHSSINQPSTSMPVNVQTINTPKSPTIV